MTSRSFKESLAGWTGLPRLDSRFEPRMTRAAARTVSTLLADATPRSPDQFDLEQLHRRVTVEWHRHRALDGLGLRDLGKLPWILFYPPGSDRQRWLGAIPGLVRQYGRWLGRGRRTRALLTLLHEFLRAYPTDLRTFNDIRRLLRRGLNHGGTVPPPSMRKWGHRSAQFGLLEPPRTTRFVSKLLSDSTKPDEMLDAAGLSGGLARSGFLKSGIRTVLKGRESTRSAGRLRRLLALVECEGGLRFDDRSMRVEVANGLLGPHIGHPPKAETKQILQSFFLKHFRDPRLPSGKHRWAGVPEDVRRVVIRWLVERVLDQFFVLLKETAYDHHWRYREAFWRAFFDEGLIDDIWFVLGSRAEGMLRRMSDDPEVVETTAELHGAQSDQSVLLMRMPGITIAEWSHSGSCHLWLDGVRDAPSLYKQRYSAYDLRRPYPYVNHRGAHSQRHDGSAQGRWQDHIAKWLRNNTGIDIDRDSYFPSRLRAVQRPKRPTRRSRSRSGYWYR